VGGDAGRGAAGEHARRCRARGAPAADAFEGRPGHVRHARRHAFEWIADADSRLGPVLEATINGRYCWVPFAALAKVAIEAPADLRDLVWSPAQLEFVNGGQSVALVPSRYAAAGAQDDGALQLARKTEWLEIGPGQYRGLGQRVLVTDAHETGLLQVARSCWRHRRHRG
jgi:type VI secretion system protein ImpE